MIPEFFAYFHHSRICPVVNISKKILVIGRPIHQFSTLRFKVDHIPKIRSGLSITILEKKKLTKLTLRKSDLIGALFTSSSVLTGEHQGRYVTESRKCKRHSKY